MTLFTAKVTRTRQWKIKRRGKWKVHRAVKPNTEAQFSQDSMLIFYRFFPPFGVLHVHTLTLILPKRSKFMAIWVF